MPSIAIVNGKDQIRGIYDFVHLNLDSLPYVHFTPVWSGKLEIVREMPYGLSSYKDALTSDLPPIRQEEGMTNCPCTWQGSVPACQAHFVETWDQGVPWSLAYGMTNDRL